ncbi:MAG TPA: hypothetical protein ACFYEC_03725 [Candidatus Brocadiaceae bacterium]
MIKEVNTSVIQMGAFIELDNSPEIHKSFPCEFFQNPNLGAYALALGGYLHSLPPTWKPRRCQLKKHFGWGDDRYDKAVTDLKQNGYMETLNGGKSGGATIRFSIYKKFSIREQLKVVHKRIGEKPESGKTGIRKNPKHRYININENISKSIYKEHKHTNAFLESDIAIKLKKWGWYPGKIVKEINKHGMHVISYQVGLIEEGHKANPVNNLGGALTAQLKRLEKKDE